MNTQPRDASRSDTQEYRCTCGSLLARRVGDHIELKCRRCKRIVGIATIDRLYDQHRCSATAGGTP